MDVSILANLFLFLGALGANFALSGNSDNDSDPADTDPLYNAEAYASTEYGTEGDDEMTTVGESGAWFLAGGADHLTGSAGADYANMGAGDDSAEMGAGADIALGGTGHDALAGGSGNDRLFGDSDDDSLWGNGGEDSLVGGTGNDSTIGGGGADTLLGGAGDDFLSGYGDTAGAAAGLTTADGIDQLFGGDGNDTILMGHGDGAMGGAGEDTFALDHRWNDGTSQFRIADFNRAEDRIEIDYIPRYSSETNAEIPPVLAIELSADGENSLIRMNGNLIAQLDGVTDLTLEDLNLVPDTTTDTAYIAANYDSEVMGTDAADSLASGTDRPTAWLAGAGADSITGSSFADYAQLGAGDDTAALAGGADSVRAEDGNDLVNGDGGDDTVWGGLGNDSLAGGAGSDRLHGEEGADRLTGNDGADSVVGGAGDDVVSGYSATAAGFAGMTTIDGIDTLSGGAGNDTLIIGRGDIALGGTGDDTFAIDNRWLESTQVAVITDYVKGEDLLEIHYTPTFSSGGAEVPPVLILEAGPGNTYVILRVNGEPVAHVMGTTDVTLADVTLVRAA